MTGLPIPGLGLARSLVGAIGRAVDPQSPPPAPPPAAPKYVDYGSLMTPPAPFHSFNTKLWGFWAEGDEGRIQQLCDKVFKAPTAGAVRARPLSRFVMLTWGDIGRVVSATPPYDKRGGVREPQVAVWIPVALRDPTSSHDRFAMCIPFIWLDNPMSLADGRELFGYPKSCRRRDSETLEARRVRAQLRPRRARRAPPPARGRAGRLGGRRCRG